MKRVVQVVALTGLTTLVAGWLAAAPAGAATPTQVFHTQINGPLTNPINQCGFTVDSVVQVDGPLVDSVRRCQTPGPL